MVDPEQRLAQEEGEGLCRLETDHERIGQTRTLRRRDGLQLARLDPGPEEGGSCDWQPIAQMLARRQFGNHPAILGVQFCLGRNHVREDGAIPDDRGAGLVAGRFNCQESHGKKSPHLRRGRGALGAKSRSRASFARLGFKGYLAATFSPLVARF